VVDIIKLSKYIYINPLTVLLFVVCYFNRQLEILVLAYFVMIIHESAHLLAAYAIGLKPAYISLHPFGVNLKLKNKIVCNLSDEIILYLSGPLINILITLLAIFMPKNRYTYFFALENIILFIMNIMPIYPLDGGVVLKKIIAYKTGDDTAVNIMRVIGVLFTAVLTIFFIFYMMKYGFNYSMLFMDIFLIANIFTQKEKYNADLLKEVMFYRKKGYGNKKPKLVICGKNDDKYSVIKKFRNDSFYIIALLDENENVDEFLTETEYIDRMLRKI